jgi:hypothetical protein
MILANTSVKTGKWYWEVEMINYPTAEYVPNVSIMGQNDNSIQYYNNNVDNCGTISENGSAIKSGDVIGVLLDADNGKVEYYKNGSSQGEFAVDVKKFGNFKPFVGLYQPNVDVRINFGATQFKYGDKIPSGYLPFSVAESIKLSATQDSKQGGLSWNSIGGATGYNIYKGEKAGGPYSTTPVNSSPVTETTYSDNTLKSGETSYYIVKAVANGAEGDASNEVSVTNSSTPSSGETGNLKLVLEVNKSKQLSVTDELSDNGDMTWTSSDESIATVDSNGLVKALKSGNTVITCKSKDGTYTNTINILVVDLNYQLAVGVTVGDKCRLTVDDLANTANVTWKADNPKIATVSSNGKVTAVSEGLTYVTEQAVTVKKLDVFS